MRVEGGCARQEKRRGEGRREGKSERVGMAAVAAVGGAGEGKSNARKGKKVGSKKKEASEKSAANGTGEGKAVSSDAEMAEPGDSAVVKAKTGVSEEVKAEAGKVGAGMQAVTRENGAQSASGDGKGEAQEGEKERGEGGSGEGEKGAGKQEEEVVYRAYVDETDLPTIMELVDEQLSEPYSIFTYRWGLFCQEEGKWLSLCLCLFL